MPTRLKHEYIGGFRGFCFMEIVWKWSFDSMQYKASLRQRTKEVPIWFDFMLIIIP